MGAGTDGNDGKKRKATSITIGENSCGVALQSVADHVFLSSILLRLSSKISSSNLKYSVPCGRLEYFNNSIAKLDKLFTLSSIFILSFSTTSAMMFESLV